MIQVDAHRARFARIRNRVYVFHTPGEPTAFKQDRSERSFEFPDQGFTADIWHQRLKGAVVLKVRVCLHSGEISRKDFTEAIDLLQVTLSVHFGDGIAYERERQQGWAMVGTYPALPGVVDTKRRKLKNRPPAKPERMGMAERRGRW